MPLRPTDILALACCRAAPYFFLPILLPMDEVHGIISISFASVPAGLPMLSLFHIRNPCSERESFQTRSLGSYKDS